MIIIDEDNNEMLMSWWRESFDWQNGHYKLTGKCDKHTILFAFKLLQSNNPI